MKRDAHSGNTTLEYGLVIGLVAMSLYGLSTLGTAISGNLGTVPKSNETLSVLSPLEESRGGEAAGESGGGSGGGIGTGTGTGTGTGKGSPSGNIAIFPDDNLAPGESGERPQVSGINGDVVASTVIANPIKQTDKDSSADKKEFNKQVVALGLKGQDIAGKINEILFSLSKKKDKKEKNNQKEAQIVKAQSQIAFLNTQIANYKNVWLNIKNDQSGEFKDMSSNDQAKLSKLVQQSIVLMQNAVSELNLEVADLNKKGKEKGKEKKKQNNNTIANDSTQVKTNNIKVEACGDGSCQ